MSDRSNLVDIPDGDNIRTIFDWRCQKENPIKGHKRTQITLLIYFMVEISAGKYCKAFHHLLFVSMISSSLSSSRNTILCGTAIVYTLCIKPTNGASPRGSRVTL
jgi:hypothetical protein